MYFDTMFLVLVWFLFLAALVVLTNVTVDQARRFIEDLQNFRIDLPYVTHIKERDLVTQIAMEDHPARRTFLAIEQASRFMRRWRRTRPRLVTAYRVGDEVKIKSFSYDAIYTVMVVHAINREYGGATQVLTLNNGRSYLAHSVRLARAVD